MTQYELEDENIMTSYTMNWPVVSHFALKHPMPIQDFFWTSLLTEHET